VTSLVSDVAATAAAPMLPGSVSQCIWAAHRDTRCNLTKTHAASARLGLAQPGYTELCEEIAEFKRDHVELNR